MYELDKAAFGRFLAQLRREKGMTQKELAATLYVSDKAVSKWKRGRACRTSRCWCRWPSS
jgi:DNA-binding transcriptional regulator YiaG